MKIGRSIGTAVATHNALLSGVHGVEDDYLAKSTNEDQLIRDADVAALAAIAYAKLALEGKIDNDDIKVGAGIAYLKLALEGKIDNDDIKAGAGIALAKLDSAVCSKTEADDKIAAVISSGTYTGDGDNDRAIPHGLGVIPRLVLVSRAGHSEGQGLVNKKYNIDLFADTSINVPNWDATNFYVSHTTVLFNHLGSSHNWVAFA